jgi:ribonuclease HI
MPERPRVILFTDGACSGNPGPGGWAYILRHAASGKEKSASGGAVRTTNNRMELSAVIEGLKALTRPAHVRVVTDSQYVSRGMSEWLPGWKRNNWRRGKKAGAKPVKNVELWQALDALCGEHEVEFEHVRGHAGHPENEACDQMAVAAAEQAARGVE